MPNGKIYKDASSDGVEFPIDTVLATQQKEGGFAKHTVGETLAQQFEAAGIDKQDPHSFLTQGKFTRRDEINSVLTHVFKSAITDSQKAAETTSASVEFPGGQKTPSALSIGLVEDFLAAANIIPKATGVGLAVKLTDISAGVVKALAGENGEKLVTTPDALEKAAIVKKAFGGKVNVKVVPDNYKIDREGKPCGIPAFITSEAGRKLPVL